MTFIRQTIKRHIENNALKYIICIVLFAVGIVFGVLFASNQSGDSMGLLTEEIRTTLKNVQTSDFDSANIFKASTLKVLRNTLIIFASGFCLYLLPLSPAILFLCGFSCGFTLFCLGANIGTDGFLIGISSVLLDFFICIPIYFVMSVNAVNYAVQKRKKRYEQTLGSYFVCTVLLFLALIPSIIADSFIVPEIVRSICMHFTL